MYTLLIPHRLEVVLVLGQPFPDQFLSLLWEITLDHFHGLYVEFPQIFPV